VVGIGPAKARDLYNAGIKSLEDLVNLDIVSFHEMVLLLVLHDRQNRV
jgi:predicted RecB family nuclease